MVRLMTAAALGLLSIGNLVAQEPPPVTVTGAAAKKDDDRERRAKAAIAMSTPGLKFAPALAPPPHVKAAACLCPPGTRGAVGEQLVKALAGGMPVVAFYGGVEPKCGQGTLIGSEATRPASVSAQRPIVVYAPTDKSHLLVVAELPPTATEDEILAAVKKAKDLSWGRPK